MPSLQCGQVVDISRSNICTLASEIFQTYRDCFTDTVRHVTISSRTWGRECPITLLQIRGGVQPSPFPTAVLRPYIYQHHKLPSRLSRSFPLAFTVVQPYVPRKVPQHSPTLQKFPQKNLSRTPPKWKENERDRPKTSWTDPKSARK